MDTQSSSSTRFLLCCERPSTIFYICGVCQLLAGLFFGAFAEVERAKVEDKKD